MTTSNSSAAGSSDLHPEAEVLAALVDGLLDESERQKTMAHISRCEDCYESFAEVLRITEELAAEAPAEVGKTSRDDRPENAALVEVPAWNPELIQGRGHSDSRPAQEIQPQKKRRGWGARGLAAAGLAAAITFVLVRPNSLAETMDPGQWTSRWPDSNAVLASPISDFPNFRGSPNDILDGADAMQLGAVFTHFQYLVDSGRLEEARENLEFFGGLGKIEERIGLTNIDEDLAVGRPPPDEKMDEMLSFLQLESGLSLSFDLGCWTELVRIAVAEKDLRFFRLREIRGFHERFVLESKQERGLPGGLPLGAAGPLQKVTSLFKGGVTEDELPQIQEAARSLLRLR